MIVPNTSMHPGTYRLYPLRPQVMAQPEGNQWLRPFSNAMEQQHGLIPPSSVCVDPAVLQSTTAAPGVNLHSKEQTFQGVMKGQAQHDQGHQQPRPFVPAPSRLSAAPESPSASVGRAKHRARKTRCSSAVLGHRKSRPNHGHLQTVSTRRFQVIGEPGRSEAHQATYPSRVLVELLSRTAAVCQEMRRLRQETVKRAATYKGFGVH